MHHQTSRTSDARSVPRRSRGTRAAVGVFVATTVALAGPAQGAAPARTATQPAPAAAAAPVYVNSTATIANPERGFYHDPGRCDRDDFSSSTLRGYREQDKITLVLCDFYFTRQDGSPNVTGPIRAEQLTTFDQQAATLRAAGAKMILRFAYTDADSHDAAPAVVQSHLDQLTPHLRRNSDVIAVVQSGFVGRWGEGYYTDHFGNAGKVTPADWANRKAVVDKLLTILPTRMVQVRTIAMKTTMYGPTPAAVARVGHHNDCFLRNPTDMGTYRDPAVDMPYLAVDSRHVAVGGETCGTAAPGAPPDRTDCSQAMPEMDRFHYSYLNEDYEPSVIAKWRAQGCKARADQKLGYRLSLQDSQIPASVRRGATFQARLAIRNTGWAAPFNPRPVFLVMRNTSSHAVVRVRLAADPRSWGPGTWPITQNIATPANLPAGQYELLLSLPDAAAPLRANPDYAIRMATEDVWEPATGFNKLLRTITVTVP